jgi:hypothetical protein
VLTVVPLNELFADSARKSAPPAIADAAGMNPARFDATLPYRQGLQGIPAVLTLIRVPSPRGDRIIFVYAVADLP